MQETLKQPLPHDPATQDPMPSIRRLVLGDFRSYAALDLALQPGLVVLTGENGAGKTNLIEAISFLCPGRGLRRAELAECARAGGMGGWSVFVELATASGRRQLGIGTELQQDATLLRRYRLDREPVASLKPFADLIRIIWLTPSMDGLFSGPAGERRRFLDRLVLAVDAEQGTKSMRSNVRCAIATACSKRMPIAAGSMPLNMRSPNWPSRSLRRAPKP